MRRNGYSYEYIASYVDDLFIVAKEPEMVVKHLQDICKYKLKGTGSISFHLDYNYFLDDDKNLCYRSRQYIHKLINNFVQMIGYKPKFYWSSLAHGDHAEIDMSEELDEKGIKQYQPMLGFPQLEIFLGTFDISTTVMTLSFFQVSSRIEHLQRAK